MDLNFSDTTKIGDGKNTQTMNTLQQPIMRSESNNQSSYKTSQVAISTLKLSQFDLTKAICRFQVLIKIMEKIEETREYASLQPK